MELLNQEEIESIVKHCGNSKVLHWSIHSYADKLIGYLGDHLRLNVEVELEGVQTVLQFFVKCMPRFDKWKANYLKELNFFNKEYVMLSRLFKEFECNEGPKWRPRLFYVREDLFVFEDLAEIGYSMPSHLETMSYDEIMSTVETLAKYHAQSYIYEERMSAELNRPYRIWEDYSNYLQEPLTGLDWRDTGRNAVIDFLKEYSAYKSEPDFSSRLEIIPKLFHGAMTLMKPSLVYRNAVVHRDLWTNNIFLKRQDNGKTDALIVDFQTVLYCSPMLDLSSLIYFNTSRGFRNTYTSEIIHFYYTHLRNELRAKDVDICTIFDEDTLQEAYEESVMFGITQAAIIVPIVTMSVEKREELFSNPETSIKVNTVSRSSEFIEIAKEDENYRYRIIELFDEIVDRSIMEAVKDNELKMSQVDYITEEDVKVILTSYGYFNNENAENNYCFEVCNASNKMLGFLADYWRLKIIVTNNNEKKLLSFFIKAIPRSNAAKADMVKEMKVFDLELFFYKVIKSCIDLSGLKPWSAKFVTSLDDAIVFQDLNALQYKLHNKFERFDKVHTLQALGALARFHASSIIYEQNRSKELGRRYQLSNEFKQICYEGSYKMGNTWFVQCKNGALESIRTFSKYGKCKEIMDTVDRGWNDIWEAAMDLNNQSNTRCKVMCHRDLWNNNILFHYKSNDDGAEPDDCILVDFQAVKYQAPASDVMFLLYCNIDPEFRDHNMVTFLNYYYEELKSILCRYGVDIDDVLTNEEFLVSAEEQRLWGLIGCACIIPLFWLDEDLTTNTFCDSAQFENILSKDKPSFIKKIMEQNQGYKKKVMEIFDEIVERYCLQSEYCE